MDELAGTPATMALAGVLGHDGVGADDRPVADRDAGDDRHGGAEPHLAADHDRGGHHVRVGPSTSWLSVVNVLPCPMSVVADADASGVLEAASDVDEDVLPKVRFLPNSL